MSNDLLKSLTEQSMNMFAPFQAYNRMMVTNLEKATELQLNAMKQYRDLSINQMKRLADVESASDFSEVSKQQMEFVNELSKQMLEDTQRVSEFGAEMQSSLQAFMTDAVKMSVPEAPETKATKPAAAAKATAKA